MATRTRRATAGRWSAADELAEQAVEAAAGAEDPGAVAAPDLLADVGRAVATWPALVREGAGLGVELARVAAGRSKLEPDERDKRFADPTWRDNPAYRRVAQLYLAWSRALERAVGSANGDWHATERARFATNFLTSAAAPTNTLLGNPAALKRAFETGGRSLLRGARNLGRDLLHNGAMPSQVDVRHFKLGENLAATPGAVVYRDEVCEVMQYTPTTARVRTRPVVMIPPQINKYYFMDMAPGRSFIEYAVSRGLQFFCISWRNPRREHADWELDDYAQRCLQAVDVAREVTGSAEVNTIGLCAGGITQAAMLSHLAATGDGRVNAAAFSVTLLDFSVPAAIGMWQAPSIVSQASGRSRRTGVLDGAELARAFAWLRPNDLVWNYFVNNYLLGNDPPAFDILAWNADFTNLPAALHEQFLEIFGRNRLVQPGAMTVLGTPVDLSKVTCDTFVTGAVTDHLTPWRGCYRTTQLLGGESEFVLSSSGHIQSLVNPPGNPKMYCYSGGRPGPDPDAWLERAERRTASWWERWGDWVTERSGPERPAPRRLGSRRHPAGDPAPGRYVHEPAKGAPTVGQL